MVSIVGIYENGHIKLDQDYPTKKPVKVIVTFIEEVPNASKEGITLSDFSFAKSKKKLEDFQGSFSDAVVEQRRAEQ